MILQPFLIGGFLSLFVGAGWVVFGKLLRRWKIPFERSGWMTPVWFLPAILAGLVQLHFDQSWLGLIFLVESLAALVSGFLGPLGWMSFHFGVFQGLLGELAFAIKRDLYLLAGALCVADFILICLHPRLDAIRAYSWRKWRTHFMGVVISSLGLAFLLNLTTNFAHAMDSRCAEALDKGLSSRKVEGLLMVADFDGSMVDTDAILISKTIPRVLDELIRDFRFGAYHPISLIRRSFHGNAINDLPSTYTLEAWRNWGFPVDMLPRQWGRTDTDRLKVFWAKMKEEFRPYFYKQEKRIPFLRHFLELHEKMANLPDSRNIFWIVLTARLKHEAVVVDDYLGELLITPDRRRVISAGSEQTDFGGGSVQIGQKKLAELARLRSEFPRHLMVFLDNDIEILKQARGQLENVILFRSTRVSHELY